MGSLDSAEVCELVGLFLLSQLEQLIPKANIGLYRDDGLAVLELAGPQIERLRKNVIKLFSKHNLQITTQVNIKVTDFLDVIFNLQTGLHRPYRKETCNTTYVHKDSNHPKHIKKALPKMIGRRISDLSSNQEVFKSEVTLYNDALKAAGYNDELLYTEKVNSKKKTRKRTVIWFNPPWNDEVSTNVARKFLAMIDRHFPKGSVLGKHFNKNTVKISYSSMPNMARIISGHNKKMTGASKHMETKDCNCRTSPCPLDGKCKTTDLVYQSNVETEGSIKQYIGLTSNTFKMRFTDHKSSFTHREQSHKTTLSSHIWKLKDRQTPFTQHWSILSLAPSYSKKVRTCHLCLMEKKPISLADPTKTLNKRNEIVAKCWHQDKK